MGFKDKVKKSPKQKNKNKLQGSKLEADEENEWGQRRIEGAGEVEFGWMILILDLSFNTSYTYQE